MSSPFVLCGLTGTTEQIRINVYSLNDAHAFINFSKDTNTTKEFQPVFNLGANCFDTGYTIEKKNGDYNWLTLTVAKNPEIGRSLGTNYPYKAMSYTFPMEKKYSLFTVLYNEDALKRSFKMMLNKKNNIYSISEGKKLEREDLTDEMLKGIEKSKKAIDNEYDLSRYGTKIAVSEKAATIMHKPILEPIFTAKCADDKNDSETESEDKVEKQILPSVDRADGFYTVVDFKEGKYDIKKYELPKDPSITRGDILSINKIISDDGGYEIELIFSKTGSQKFAELTRDNIRKPVAVVVNKLIVSTLVFNSEITGGKFNIAEGSPENEIDELIANLKK